MAEKAATINTGETGASEFETGQGTGAGASVRKRGRPKGSTNSNRASRPSNRGGSSSSSQKETAQNTEESTLVIEDVTGDSRSHLNPAPKRGRPSTKAKKTTHEAAVKFADSMLSMAGFVAINVVGDIDAAPHGMEIEFIQPALVDMLESSDVVAKSAGVANPVMLGFGCLLWGIRIYNLHRSKHPKKPPVVRENNPAKSVPNPHQTAARKSAPIPPTEPPVSSNGLPLDDPANWIQAGGLGGAFETM